MTEPYGAVELTNAGPVVRFERRYPTRGRRCGER